MKASHVLGALLLAGACLPATAQPRAHGHAHVPPAGGALADTDLLYCAQVYAEGAALLKADPDPGVRRTGRDALRRSRVLGASDIDLLNEDPARHKQASLLAQERLAAMPTAPLEARRLALRAAYVECRHLQESAAVVPAVSAAGVKPAPATGATRTADTGSPAARAPEVEIDDLVPPIAVATSPAPASAPAVLPAPRKESALRHFWRGLTGQPQVAASRGPASMTAAAPASTSPTFAAAASALVPKAAPARAPGSALIPLTDTDAAELPAIRPGLPVTPAATAATVTPAAPATPRLEIPTPAPVATPVLPQAPAPAARPAATPARAAPVPAPAPAPAPTRTLTPTPRPAPLSDADTLYCEQVYAEVAGAVGDDNADAREVARDARERWRVLHERDYDLLNDNPARHSRATTAARQRLAGLPAQPGRVRSLALRTAYEDCRTLEARAATTAPPAAAVADRARMLANRRFCRDLMQAKLKVSPKLRAAFTPSERDALDEIEKIAAALAQPMPGAPPTLEQDREANQLQAQLRATLDQAVANRSDARDPVVLALGQCHEDYVQGLLGGPDVLAAARTDAPAAGAPSTAAPDVRMADLGPVFHVREVTPAGAVEGIWFRRGQGSLYDGVWVQAGNGRLQRDVLELRGIIDGELTLWRQGYQGSYRARVRADGTLAPGAASWFTSPAYSWGPLPAQRVRGADLGALVHMREVTPYGNYEGIWRQRGKTGIYDVAWVFLPTGELTSDVLAVSGVAGGQLVIRRLEGPGLFPLKRRADAMAYKDPLTGGKVPARWEVVPAQPLRLGAAPR